MERKRSQEKRDRELEERKRREKERLLKEDIVAKRSEKETKKVVEQPPIVMKKVEASVSPKKLQSTSLPVTRHRVSY